MGEECGIWAILQENLWLHAGRPLACKHSLWPSRLPGHTTVPQPSFCWVLLALPYWPLGLLLPRSCAGRYLMSLPCTDFWVVGQTREKAREEPPIIHPLRWARHMVRHRYRI